MKIVTPIFSRIFAHRKSKGNIGKAVEQRKKLCNEVDTLREFIYLGGRVSAGGGYEVIVIATIR